MGRGPGCGTATAIEGGERLYAGTRYRTPAVKYGSYPGGGAVMTAEGERRGGGRLRRRWGRGLSYDISRVVRTVHYSYNQTGVKRLASPGEQIQCLAAPGATGTPDV